MSITHKRFLYCIYFCVFCSFFVFTESDKKRNRLLSGETEVTQTTVAERDNKKTVIDSGQNENTDNRPDEKKDHLIEKDTQSEGKNKNNGFSSIQDNTLMIADGNRWYYEAFDTNGRISFAVLYENDIELERKTCKYASDNAVYPVEQITVANNIIEKINYTPQGKTLRVEKYDQDEKLIEKTENTYNTDGNLIKQMYTKDGTVKKSVWSFAHDKVISETKYCNGEKTAFIEMHNGKRIVHLYKNDREVFVTEE